MDNELVVGCSLDNKGKVFISAPDDWFERMVGLDGHKRSLHINNQADLRWLVKALFVEVELWRREELLAELHELEFDRSME